MNKKQPIWRVSKIQTASGERWIVELLRTDAAEPYYLTEKIFRFESTARRELERVLNELSQKK